MPWYALQKTDGQWPDAALLAMQGPPEADFTLLEKAGTGEGLFWCASPVAGLEAQSITGAQAQALYAAGGWPDYAGGWD